MERQEWLLAREVLCHRCRAKLFGIPVQAAAVTRAAHSNHTQKGKTKSMFWVCKCGVLAAPELLVVPACCCLRRQYKTYFGRTQNEFLILLLEITSDDVMGHPQLLAARQPEGFPIMVKQPGCSSMEGRVRSAPCFLIPSTFSGGRRVSVLFARLELEDVCVARLL